MSFGRHFLPSDYVKPSADIGKFYDELMEKEIRSQIHPPNLTIHRLTQEAGRRLDLGVDAVAVKEHVNSQIRREKAKNSKHRSSSYDESNTKYSLPTYRSQKSLQSKSIVITEKPHQVHDGHHYPPPIQPTISTVISKNRQREGGIFHRPDITDEYQEYFEARPADNSYTKNTPKLWPKTTEHPMTASILRHLNESNHNNQSPSKLMSSMSSLSLTQPTLHPSGQYSEINNHSSINTLSSTAARTKIKHQQQEQDALAQVTQKYRLKMVDHVRWLEAPTIGKEQKVESTLATIALQRPTDTSIRKRIVKTNSLPRINKEIHSSSSHTSTRSNARTKSDKSYSSSSARVLPPFEKELPQELEETDQLSRTISHSSSVNGENIDDSRWENDSSPSLQASQNNNNNGNNGMASSNQINKKLKKINGSPRSQSILQSSHTKTSVAESIVSQLSSNSLDPFASQLSQLNLTSLHDSLNPFRRRHDYHYRSSNTRYMTSPPTATVTSIAAHSKDPLKYKEDHYIRSLSKFNAVYQPELGFQSIPSRTEVTRTLVQMTRQQILHYHARVVEIGVMIQVMKSPHTHPTPGLEAVFALHQACIHASGVNMNPYILKKNQLFTVLHSQVSAVPEASISRLLLAMDQTNTGIFRYVRLTAALLAAMDAALLTLSVTLEPIIRDKMEPYIHFRVFRAHDSKYRHDADGNTDVSSIALPSGLSQMEPPNPVKYHMKTFDPYKPNNKHENTSDMNTEDDSSSMISELTGQLVCGPDHFMMPSSSLSVCSEETQQQSLTFKNRNNPYTIKKNDRPVNKLGYEKLSDDEWKELRCEILLLQLLHQLYCECHGFEFPAQIRMQPHTQPSSQNNYKKKDKEEPSMRLEDLLELFSCCVSSADDELLLKQLVTPMQQYLFHRLAQLPAAFLSRGMTLPSSTTQSKLSETNKKMKTNDFEVLDVQQIPESISLSSTIDIDTMLKHPELRTLFATLTVSWMDLLDAVYLHTPLLKEFVRQVKVFRASVTESNMQLQMKHTGQTNISDAIAHFGQEGAHNLSS